MKMAFEVDNSRAKAGDKPWYNCHFTLYFCKCDSFCSDAACVITGERCDDCLQRIRFVD